MSGILAVLYPWVKAVHIMAVLSWMAGLFYLPRLYVYHAERGQTGVEPAASFLIMEDKLMRVIMAPAMGVTWIAGILLVLTPGIVDFSMIWPWTKMVGVLGMSWFHSYLRGQRQALAEGRGLSGRSYRLLNEVPTVLMIVIVVSVVVKF
ncbi:MAG: CopD family protein [Paracoccus sp. (in: a-proteobacteria)]|nr:CopD family protein [Paracoccus sp. (in: a-proteobacteria)]